MARFGQLRRSENRVLKFYLARPTGQKQYCTSLLHFLEYFFTMATPAKMMAMATNSRGPKGSR